MDFDSPTCIGTVYPWHCDFMGHMNVMHYVGRFDEGTWQFFGRLGLTPEWLVANHRGMVAVEQNLRYHRELRVGALFEIRTRLITAGAKSIRFAHEMRFAGSDTVAAECELTGVHIDTVARRAVAFGDEVAQRLASLLPPDGVRPLGA
jgi:acyl-CoA thioester hydrolase